MEFFAAITAIVTLASEVAKLRGLFSRRRREAIRELEDEKRRLSEGLRSEGRKIQNYAELQNIITIMDEALKSIVDQDRMSSDSDKFWDNIGYQGRVLRESADRLEGFDLRDFSVKHQETIRSNKVPLRDSIQRASAYLESRTRSGYLGELRQAQQFISPLKVVGYSVLKDISRQLTDFRVGTR